MKNLFIPLLLIFIAGCSHEPEIQNYLIKADSLIIEKRFDQAIACLTSTKELFPNDKRPNALIKKIENFISDDFFCEQVGNINDEIYSDLLNGKSGYKFLENGNLNTLFIEKIKDQKEKREKCRKLSLEKKKLEEVKNEEANREYRVKYADKLQDKLYDEGLNIKVSISGKNKEIIELKYVLFNDVWVYKFEKNGTFANLKDAGFQQAVITSSYDFEKRVFLYAY